ncbi:MAG TPA: acyl-CoA dehydrogenase family protein [Noviherbaspirillum sp.]|uniref:acyl-CoA dehydrogenase family protein n=1 Tax=Noviherbaspirillum sp. TaxID=1926288 RepID=UPI002B465209|nr:acyl-CoA dehydrogenase family protein [Noviherbaspirillum sp.]HJV84557.1 acyl-CoA dehydrogenase family protein [Noviherbaspirillum sp.]
MALLSSDILELKEATRAFSDGEVAPVAQQLHLDDKEIPDDLLAKMADMGFFAVLASKEYGGLGLGAMAVAVVTEELSRGWFSVGALPARNWGSALLLEKHGTREQKERWLPGLVSGKLQAAHSGTEPEAGSDAANIKTTAVLQDGTYVLHGTKMWCTHANRADIISTFCRTSKDSKHGGISMLFVEKVRGDQFMPPQLTGSHIKTVGYHGMHSYQLFFDGFEVPASNLLGGVEGQAFKQLMAVYELARMQFAFRCIGLAQAAYESALEYSQSRVQFGQPICKFQAIRHKLADMATQIEAARQLGYMVAQKMDQGVRVDLEAGMVKLFASEMAHRVCHEAVQIHGGTGFAIDTAVNRYWRDSGLCTIGEGTSEVQREVIARRILGER